MKALALALAASVIAAPAMAGPYVKSKHEFKGTDEDFSKSVHQGRVGYSFKAGKLSPYIEGGVGVVAPDGGDTENFTALEVGTKVKITEKFGGYGKYENIFNDDSTRDWKVEVGTKYEF